MSIAKVEINNIRNIDSLTLEPGVLNIISGDNGEGKTTILKAIGVVFEGGHKPNMRRRITTADGAGYYRVQKGEVKLTLADGKTLHCVIREKKTERTIISPDGTEVPCEKEFLQQLAAGFSFDPMKFVEANPKDRLAYLQEVLGVFFSAEEIAEACEMRPPGPVNIDGLDEIRKTIYDARTKVNGQLRQAKSTVERLSATLGVDENTDWNAEIQRIQKARDGITAAISTRKQQVSSEANEARRQIDEEIDQQIKALEDERRRQKEACDKAEREAYVEIDDQSRDQLTGLTAELTAAQEKSKNAAQQEVWAQEVKTAQKDADLHAAGAAALTAKLSRIDGLKRAKLEAMPIEGVEFIDGELFVNGINFDELNTGEQFLRAFQIGGLKPGSFMIADRSECLSSETFELFKQAAIASGIQVFTTRISSGELNVECIDQPELVSA